MTSFRIPPADDPIGPADVPVIRIALDGHVVDGIDGQTIAGVILGSGTLAWRTTSRAGRPRGVFCGIGVCYDCLVEVNGARDVRACQRRARDGDVVSTQCDALPGAVPAAAAVPGSGALTNQGAADARPLPRPGALPNQGVPDARA